MSWSSALSRFWSSLGSHHTRQLPDQGDNKEAAGRSLKEAWCAHPAGLERREQTACDHTANLMQSPRELHTASHQPQHHLDSAKSMSPNRGSQRHTVFKSRTSDLRCSTCRAASCPQLGATLPGKSAPRSVGHRRRGVQAGYHAQDSQESAKISHQPIKHGCDNSQNKPNPTVK